MNFVTLAQAKRHLNIHPTNTDHDIDVLEKIMAASEIFYGRMNPQVIPSSWIVANTSPVVYNVPWKAKAIVLMIMSDLYQNREAGISQAVSDAIKNLMGEYRLPPIA